MLSNYTWAKNLTDADSDYAPQEAWNGGVGGMFDPYDPKKEKTYSEFDQPQQFKIAYTYELPFGRGKQWGGNVNKLTDAAIGGWTLGGVDTYATGFPSSCRRTIGQLVPLPARRREATHGLT